MKIEINTKWELIKAIFITTLVSIIFSNILVYIFETLYSPPLASSDIIGTTLISGLASLLASSIIFYQNFLVSKTKADMENVNRRLLNAQKKLRKQANTDSLTGLFNRRSYFLSMKKEISRYERQQRPFSLLLMDIDHFKKVNDSFGHSRGDVVLQKLAKILQETAREQDIVARTGGEEFSILLPEAKKEEAKVMAERIRETVSKSEMGSQEIEIQITISIGVAEILPGEDVDAIYNRADLALYRAKAKGRNCVELD